MKCYIAVVSLCGSLLAGCVSTTSQSLKDANYSQKIQSVALIENRGLADKYPMLNDRTGLIIKELNAKFTQSKIPFETATVKSQDNLALNANSQALSSIKPSVKHFLSMTVTRAVVQVHVDFYDLSFVVVDRATGKEVWKSLVKANWYSKPEEIAAKIYSQLSADGLI